MMFHLHRTDSIRDFGCRMRARSAHLLVVTHRLEAYATQGVIYASILFVARFVPTSGDGTQH
jgi:hypothetical protein